MSAEILIAVLAFGTMGAVCVFAYLSAVRTEARRRSGVRRSTLAADAPDETPPGVRPVDV